MDKRLGFGFMRLPLTDHNDPTSFDYVTLNKLVDAFLERGFSYFDTAYVYHGYRSEDAVRQALVKRHSRGDFQLATKMPMRDIHTPEDMEKVFDEQLKKCGVEYFDSYLLHNLGVNTYRNACKLDSFGFCLQKKREGKIKKLGFSFHDSPQLLEEILTAHPGLDFVQLQINYLDWNSPAIQSRSCYEVARRHRLPIIVMEPLKGGNLAMLPESAEKLMREYAPHQSPASWGIRFAAGLEGVAMVLSGMNAMGQLLDNTDCMANFSPLCREEYDIIEKVTDIINENSAVPCTICRYCEKDCPKNIAIPDYFALYNNAKRGMTSQFVYYLNLAATRGRAGDCIGCGQCENACPQHLKITQHLRDVSATFDTISFPIKKQ